MGNNNSRRIEILEKRNKKIHELIENNEKNIKRLVDILAKIPGASLEVDHLKVNKTFMLQDTATKNYIYVSYDSKTNEFKVDKSTRLKDEQKCTVM